LTGIILIHHHYTNMKNKSLLTALVILGVALNLHAQSSMVLIKTGDQVGGISSNPATITSIVGTSMNDNGDFTIQGYATETNVVTYQVTNTDYTYSTNYVPATNYSYTYSTNYIPSTNYSYSYTTNYIYSTNYSYIYSTNYITLTNYSYSYYTNFIPYTNITVNPITNIVSLTNNIVNYQYTNVLTSNTVINFYGTVTNVLSTTNRWNVNGSTNTYVNQIAQIQYTSNSRGTFTNIMNYPQGYHLATNSFVTNISRVSYQTNYTITNRAVISISTNSILTNRPVVSCTTNSNVTSNPVISITTNSILTNRPVVSCTTNCIVTSNPVAVITTNSIITNRVFSSISSYGGIWVSGTNGSINLMIKTGPSAGINWVNNLVINNNGAVAFIGYSMATNSVMTTNGLVTNAPTNAGSIYLALPGSTNPISVASVGSPAPGLPDNFTSFGTIVLPDVGGVIFTGWAGTNNGIWVQNSDLSVHLVVTSGQSITVGSSNKVISSFSLMNGFHSQDTGAVTYQAKFTDGSSAAVRVNR